MIQGYLSRVPTPEHTEYCSTAVPTWASATHGTCQQYLCCDDSPNQEDAAPRLQLLRYGFHVTVPCTRQLQAYPPLSCPPAAISSTGLRKLGYRRMLFNQMASNRLIFRNSMVFKLVVFQPMVSRLTEAHFTTSRLLTLCLFMCRKSFHPILSTYHHQHAPHRRTYRS